MTLLPNAAPRRVFTLGSLFSGIGGLELGLEMTGAFRTVWQVEQSEYCRKVLRRHWPDALQFEDVRNVGKENLPAVDVICGGFPCQDVSKAGRKEGLRKGNRSGLWYEYSRIVDELRPRFIVVENVAALLSDGMGVVLGTLAELGYDARWTVLSACAVGAPHSRERVFLVADSHRHQLAPALPQNVRQKSGRFTATFRREDRNRLEVGSAHHRGASGVRWSAKPDIRGVVDGLPDRVERNHALGNAVVPQCARVIGEWLLEIDAELSAEGAA